MKQVIRARGQVTFHLPDAAAEPADLIASATRDGARAGPDSQTDEAEFAAIIDALVNPDSQIRPDSSGSDRQHGGARSPAPHQIPPAAGITVLDSFAIELVDLPSGARSAGSTAGVDPIDIDVQLEAGEGAVILLEQEGTYEWRFPEASVPAATSSPGGSARGGVRGPVETQRHLRFTIDVRDDAPPAPVSRGVDGARGRITSFIKGKIKGYILKFVVRKVVGAITRRLESGVLEGPVVISSADAQNWLHKDSFVGIPLPTDRTARILLLVHGTFSSTVGSFAALTRHPEGLAFLQTAYEDYDAVLGYDHYTLAETPDQNAEAIHGALRELLEYTPSLSIDAIAFSRGGLVLRYLSEQVTPLDGLGIHFNRLVFVACTNAGTELANEENWNDLVDFYTNMVAGATRLLGYLPGAAVPTRILRGAVQAIGSMVTYIAEDAVTNRSVPGVAAMQPAGDFVRAINQLPSSRLTPAASEFYAIGSSFEPDRNTANGALGKRLIAKAADGLIDRLMGEDNDLVVNTESMFVIDPVPGANLKEKNLFDDNGQIYHTVYFAQPLVATALSGWLRDQPDS